MSVPSTSTYTAPVAASKPASKSYGGDDSVILHKPPERFIGMFSYGSNNEQQLRARLNSPQLRGCPAFLDGYVRVFGFSSPPWGGGSVASVATKKGGRVYGCFYLMTPGEVETLDLYEHVKEGGYSKQAVMVKVCMKYRRSGHGSDDHCNSDGTLDVESSAITYIMTQRYVKSFAQPSPQYLTAVYRTLTSNFPELAGQPVEIRDHSGKKRSEWSHPGCRDLPLAAFLLEVGLCEEPPWMFPYVLNPLVARLEAAGMRTTDEVCRAATDGSLLNKLASARGSVDLGNDPVGRKSNHSEEAASEGGSASVGIGVISTTNAGTDASVTESGRKILAQTVVPDFTRETVEIILQLI